MQKISIFLLILFLLGCERIRSPCSSYEISEKEKLVDSVMFQVAQKLKKEKNLSPCGNGGRIMHGVQLLRLMFDYYKPLDIEQGRKLLIDAAAEFVSQINAKEKLRQYLYRYPFQLDDVEIHIYVANPNGSPIKNGDIKILTITDGVLRFEIDDPGYPFLLTMHHETIDEALSLVTHPSSEPLVLKPLPRTLLPGSGENKLGAVFMSKASSNSHGEYNEKN